MIMNPGKSMATISESIDETSSIATWHDKSNQKFRMNSMMTDKTIPSNSDEIDKDDKNTPMTQRNKNKAPLEFENITVETRVSTTVKKEKRQESDDENVDMLSASGMGDSVQKRDTIPLPTIEKMEETSPLINKNLNLEDKESMGLSSLKSSPLKKDNVPKKSALKVQFMSMDDNVIIDRKD